MRGALVDKPLHELDYLGKRQQLPGAPGSSSFRGRPACEFPKNKCNQHQEETMRSTSCSVLHNRNLSYLDSKFSFDGDADRRGRLVNEIRTMTMSSHQDQG
jgi:hypothetical protein